MPYHLRRSDREITDPTELQSIIEKGKYAVVALSKDNEPYVVTLSYGYDREANVLYFHAAREGKKIDFISSNPRACATIIEDDGFDMDICDHSYGSLVIYGTIGLVNDSEEADRAIRLLIARLETRDPGHFYAKLQPGNESYDNPQVMKMTIDAITGKARKGKRV